MSGLCKINYEIKGVKKTQIVRALLMRFFVAHLYKYK